MTSNLDLVIFDCDGVLVDSELIACAAVAEGLRRLGLEVGASEILALYTGVSAPAMYSDIARRFDFVVSSQQQQEIGERVQAELACKVTAIPEVDSALLEIARTYLICVASSSSPARIAASLSRAQLDKHFGNNIFSAYQVARGKPAPDLFLFAATSMGAAPHRCCVIEDSVAGVDAAVAAGMRALGFVGGSHATPALDDALRLRGANPVFRRMSDLPKILAS